MSAYPAIIKLAALDGSNGFRLDGLLAGDNSGRSVASAGDVNGDGYADLIIGAPEADPAGKSAAGSSYVVFGKASGFAPALDLGAMDGANGFRLDGVSPGDESGFSVASAGDVNGDGYDDVIVGADLAHPGGDSAAGSSYVVFGKASGFSAALDLAGLNGANGLRLDGVMAGDNSGYTVAPAGDVNGDGYDDIMVGAPLTDPGSGPGTGSAYVVLGKASGFSPSLDLGALNGGNGFRLDGVAGSDFAALSVDGAGDVNGDGVDDMLVGAYSADPNGHSRAGSAYVVFGKTTGFAPTISLSSLNGSTGFRIDGEAIGDFSGWSVSSAGDVNGDGYADVVVGGYEAAPEGRIFAGESYVVFGRPSGFAPTFQLSGVNGANGFRIEGAAFGDQSGVSVSDAGDFNGDGFGDLIIGAIGADPDVLVDAGASYVVFGKASGFAATLDLADLDGDSGLRIDGVVALDQSGSSVACAGDVNGDGLSDLIVGAPLADDADADQGFSYVIFGRLPDGAVTRMGSAISQAIWGGEGDDLLSGLDGADTLKAGGGDDQLLGGGGADSLLAGAGDDRLLGGGDVDALLGEAGDDILQGGSGDDQLFGGSDSDRLSGGSGSDLLDGGAGDDVIDGGSGVDTVSYAASTKAVRVDLGLTGRQDTGGAGRDRIDAVENLTGSKFADALTGDDLVNVIIGGRGADTVIGGEGYDVLDGGIDVDTLDYRAAAGAVTLTLSGSTYAIARIGGVLSDRVRNFENVLGGSGADKLKGDAGANLLDGGLGADTLTGAAGADTFAFTSALGAANVDRIVDFSVPADTIHIDNAVFTALGAGALAAGAFYNGAAAHDAGDRIIYNANSGALLYDADGAGGADAVQFAAMAHNLAITAADFLVV
jgi:hypothetical protein